MFAGLGRGFEFGRFLTLASLVRNHRKDEILGDNRTRLQVVVSLLALSCLGKVVRGDHATIEVDAVATGVPTAIGN